MKISKHLHSCLLIEDSDKTTLIDPGIYTYEAKALTIEQVTKLDYILITHEHQDHCHPLFIQELVTKFPQVKVISNSSVVALLQKSGINATTEGDETISLEPFPHEKLWDKEAPSNTVFTVHKRLTHPGDSLQLTATAEILALPLQASWGSTTAAVEKALALKPKYILPIHDWHWKDEIRRGMYQRLEAFFTPLGIEFKSLETGVTVEI